MSYYNIYLGNKPYQLYIEDIPYSISDGQLPGAYGKLDVAYDDNAGKFIVKVVQLSDRGKYAMSQNRLYVVPEAMTGEHFNICKNVNSPERKVRSFTVNGAGNYWGLTYIAKKTTSLTGINNSIVDGRKINNIGESINFSKSSIINEYSEISCRAHGSNGVNSAWGYARAEYGSTPMPRPLWVKVKFYLICLDKDPQLGLNDNLFANTGINHIPSFRYKKTISPVITIYDKN